jgi:perosamine synthetase
MFRQQLPVYSPLSLRSLAAAVVRQLADGAGAADELERTLRTEYGAKQAVLVGSGTQALLLALRSAMAATRTRRVALPAFSCFDVAAAAVGADAGISLYDLDPVTLGPDMASLERELMAGARVVVASPLYGIPVDWDALSALCARHGAILIEDAAQGHGARWRSSRLGSLGAISVISFGRGKGWSGGGGGAVLYRAVEPPPAEWIAGVGGGAAKSLARSTVQWGLGRPSTYWLPASIPWLGLGATRYHAVDAVQDAPALAVPLVLATRAAADEEALVRRRVAAELIEGLRASRATPVVAPEGSEPGYLRLPLRAHGALADVRARERARRLGIMPSYPAPLASLAAVRPRLQSGGDVWPGADELVRTLLTVPTHSHVTPAEVERIVRFFTPRLGRSEPAVPEGGLVRVA